MGLDPKPCPAPPSGKVSRQMRVWSMLLPCEKDPIHSVGVRGVPDNRFPICIDDQLATARPNDPEQFTTCCIHIVDRASTCTPAEWCAPTPKPPLAGGRSCLGLSDTCPRTRQGSLPQSMSGSRAAHGSIGFVGSKCRPSIFDEPTVPTGVKISSVVETRAFWPCEAGVVKRRLPRASAGIVVSS